MLILWSQSSVGDSPIITKVLFGFWHVCLVLWQTKVSLATRRRSFEELLEVCWFYDYTSQLVMLEFWRRRFSGLLNDFLAGSVNQINDAMLERCWWQPTFCFQNLVGETQGLTKVFLTPWLGSVADKRFWRLLKNFEELHKRRIADESSLIWFSNCRKYFSGVRHLYQILHQARCDFKEMLTKVDFLIQELGW